MTPLKTTLTLDIQNQNGNRNGKKYITDQFGTALHGVYQTDIIILN